MLELRIKDNLVHVGPRLIIAFHRTLRIPDDGRTYPLPPGLGRLPIRRISDHADRVSAAWAAEGGVFIPMYQREAMWIGFTGADWKPNAVKVEAGRVNAVTGEVEVGAATLAEPQNYLVCPPQVWLDGIKTGAGVIRQFVAMPLGEGYSIEAAVTGEEYSGGLRIIVFEPQPGRFPDSPPPERPTSARPMRFAKPGSATEIGLGAGGTMRQKVYPDPHGIDTWDVENRGELRVRIVESETFRAITGDVLPPTPIDAKTYTEHGLPWFDLYDEHRRDVTATDVLAGVRTIAERDAELGREVGDSPVEIDPRQIKTLQQETDRRRPSDSRPGSNKIQG
jgi:hypothetical protein